MSIVFIGFLGTSQYKPVVYSIAGKKSQETPYVQEAIVRAHLEWLDSPDGCIKIFMTTEAKSANWDPPGGLKDRLNEICHIGKVQGLEMKAPTEENSLWRLFEVLESEIPPGAEVILDVTHGFRTLPLVGTVLTSYTRALKRTKVAAIYYGSTVMDSDGTVPVIDMTRLDRLMRWSTAIDAFLRNGNASEMEEIASETVRSMIEDGKQTETAILEKQLVKNLKEIHSALSTVRGKEILEGKLFLNALDTLERLGLVQGVTAPLVPLLEIIRNKLLCFKANSFANLLYAVDLCIQYDLIQQGLTLLQEGLITMLLAMEGFRDYTSLKTRKAVAMTFSYLEMESGCTKSYDDPRLDPELQEVATAMMINDLVHSLIKAFARLRDCRNNINHASFNKDDFRTTVFRKTLVVVFSEVLYQIKMYNKPLGDIRFKSAAQRLSDRYPYSIKEIPENHSEN